MGHISKDFNIVLIWNELISQRCEITTIEKYVLFLYDIRLQQTQYGFSLAVQIYA